MRATLIAIMIVALGGIGAAAPMTPSVHVTVSATTLDVKTHADRVRTKFAHKAQLANLHASTFDLAVSESVSLLPRREVEITVQLRVTISDRSGRMTSIVRSVASAKGSSRSISILRDEATASAIDAAIVRARAAR
jgi:hypothetical protein